MADVVEGADVGMREFGDRAGFVFKAVALFGSLRDAVGQHLDGYRAFEAGIPGAIHFSHSTGAEGRQNFERAEFLTQGKSHWRRDYTSYAGLGWDSCGRDSIGGDSRERSRLVRS